MISGNILNISTSLDYSLQWIHIDDWPLHMGTTYISEIQLHLCGPPNQFVYGSRGSTRQSWLSYT